MKKTELNEAVSEVQKKYRVIGRSKEIMEALAGIYSGKHILIEGEVGVGKTTLALAIANYLDKPFYRVDSSDQVDEAKLVGWWDPPLVLNKGYVREAFIAGPLFNAMINNGILFINELNRLPETTQNVLLPVMDEGKLEIPKLGTIEAKNGFRVIATQNPEEHIGVTALGEALKDRFVWIKLEYQPEKEEKEIVKLHSSVEDEEIISLSVKITRATRNNPYIKRGSSVRGAIDLASLMAYFDKYSLKDWINAALMALATKIELYDETEKTINEVISEIVKNTVESRFLLINR